MKNAYPNLPADDPLLEPGAYDGSSKPWVRPDDYHRSRRLSRSQMALLWPETGTPAEFIYHRENPVVATNAMIRGDAIHALAMEPDRFAQEYAFPPEEFRGKTRRGANLKAWDEFMESIGWEVQEGENPRYVQNPRSMRLVGFTPRGAATGIGKLFYDDVAIVKETAEALLADDDLRKILQGDGLTEASFCWDEEPNDGEGPTLLFRERPDQINFTKDGTVMIDLKTDIRGVSPNAWRMAVEKRRHYFQAATYDHGYEETTGDLLRAFYHVAIQPIPPYLAGVYEVGRELMEDGRAEFFHACRLLRKCVAENDWPGYARHIITIEPSEYHRRR